MSARNRIIARGLALAFVSGPWHREGLSARGRECLGSNAPFIAQLARIAIRLFPAAPLGRDQALASLLERSRTLRDACESREAKHVRVQHWLLPEPTMARPATKLRGLNIPALVSEADVASFLDIPLDELGWFADRKRLQRAPCDQKLRHYRYRWLVKRSGAYRLLEAPKPRLKAIQRRILEQILDHVPLHDSSHGHRKLRSVRTFAAPHVQQPLIVSLDLQEFFACVTEARARGIFAAVGYPDAVARLLALLCCSPTPRDVLRACPLPPFPTEHDLSRRYLQRQRLVASHLPQGAPCSPMLAALATYRLDVRLQGLARSFGATYGRYADDLAFSGPAQLASPGCHLIPMASGIVRDEGFAVRFEKTRIMRASTRQMLCGVVVNKGLSLRREVLEILEATLTNCVRHGPAGQNRAGVPAFRAHLQGRVAWVSQVHPGKGAYLSGLFSQIDWTRAE